VKSYTLKECVSEEAVQIWKEATRLISFIQGYSDLIRCHELARAVVEIVGGEVRDGKFGPIEHSWIQLKTPCLSILDPYQPGTVPQCVLIHKNLLNPIVSLYESWPFRTDIRNDVVQSITIIFANNQDINNFEESETKGYIKDLFADHPDKEDSGPT